MSIFYNFHFFYFLKCAVQVRTLTQVKEQKKTHKTIIRKVKDNEQMAAKTNIQNFTLFYTFLQTFLMPSYYRGKEVKSVPII